MANFMPGHLLLYRDPESRLLWPAVYLTDEIVPKTFLETRPSGFFTLILKLSPAASMDDLRWAMTSELNPYDPVYVYEQKETGPSNLKAAYDVADEVLETNLGLPYWKLALANHDTIVLSDDDADDELDDEMRQAIEASLLDIRAEEARRLPPTSTSSTRPKAAWQNFPDRPSNHTKLASPFWSDKVLPSRSHRTGQPPRTMLSSTKRAGPYDFSLQSTKRSASSSPLFSEDEQPSPPRRRRIGADQGPTHVGLERRRDSYFETSNFMDLSGAAHTDDNLRLPQGKASTSKYRLQRSALRKDRTAEQSASASPTYSQRDLSGPAVAAPDDDVIEENLEESNQFIQIFVGPESDPEHDPEVDPERKRHRFQLLKRHVWDRSYFRNTVHAVSYITPIGQNAWELTHPRLSKVNPDDFRFAAEYLTDGDFGHRQPDGEEQIAEAFAQCMAAWEVAQQLNMDDLQEHIINKIQATAPWGLYDVMALACCVYTSSDFPSEACHRLRDMLSSYIAEHHDIYIRDESLKEQFLDRLQQIPTLKADVHVKVAEEARARCQPNDHERELLEQHNAMIS